MMRKTLLVLLLALTLSGMAYADPGEANYGGMWCFRITADAGGYTAAERGDQLARRVQLIASDVYAQKNGVVLNYRSLPGGDMTINFGEMLVLTVTPKDAAGLDVTVPELARQWGSCLEKSINNYVPKDNPAYYH